jgi:large subunit ribosomal protein L11
MAKKTIVRFVRLQVQGGKATPAPPIGPALGSAGINIMMFCKEFNARTQDRIGQVVPVKITLFSDKSFTFILKQSPMAKLILAELGITSGSKIPNKDKVGTLTLEQVKKIAETKRPDLRILTIEAGMKMVEGTARSMGVLVGGQV